MEIPVDVRSDDGLSGSTSIAYTVAEAPTATISASVDGGTYTVGDRVETAFACAEGDFGPGLASCVDGAGASGTGVLDTTTAGSHTYRVTTTSRDGQIARASITYIVVRPADPPARRGPDTPGTPPDGGRTGSGGTPPSSLGRLHPDRRQTAQDQRLRRQSAGDRGARPALADLTDLSGGRPLKTPPRRGFSLHHSTTDFKSKRHFLPNDIPIEL